ncbi:hypothetical protein pb186bvf_018003 [Paramecium bursaria]
MISCDGPPLDFANMNVKTLKDLLTIKPRTGKRKLVHSVQETTEEEKNKDEPKQEQVHQQVQDDQEGQMDEEEREKEKERKEKERQKELRGIPVVLRGIGQQPAQNTNIQKPIIDDQKQAKEEYNVYLYTCSLILSYNRIQSLTNFHSFIDQIMYNCQKLQWIDLSHNVIENLDYNFSDFPLLKSLYLHNNLLKEIPQIEVLQKLPYLRSITIHGNPLDSIPNFRLDTAQDKEARFCLDFKKRIRQCIGVEIKLPSYETTEYQKKMKYYLVILNYDSELQNFLVKVKWGTQVQQTQTGNNWNQTFMIEKNRGDLIVEVWQKLSGQEHHLVGSAVVPKIEQTHSLDIMCKGKKEGVLNIQLKEAPKDPIIAKIDQQNLTKLQGPQKLIQKLNDSIQEQGYDYVSVQDYFSQNWNENLNLKAKHQADQITKDVFKAVTSNLEISSNQTHIEMDQNPKEQENIKKLQKQLIQQDLDKLEKQRKQIAVEILELDRMENTLRIDQIDEKQKVLQYRKELSQKLLYLEEKIQHMKRTLKQQKHHVFSANSNLLNSQAEMSMISVQKDFLEKWGNDPQKLEAQKQFVQKYMKEWKELQELREKKIQEQEAKIEKAEQQIKEFEKRQLQDKNQQKRQEIAEKLQKLKEKQQERIKQTEEAKKRFLEKKNEQYLAEKYAKQDALNAQIELEHRKQKLKENKMPEFDINEINKFDEKFLQIKQDKQLKRQKQWEEREQKWNKFKAQYYGEQYHNAKRQYRMDAVPQRDDIMRQNKEKLEEKKEYAIKIKENFLPKISSLKHEELEQQIRRLRYEPDFKKYREISQNVRSKHIYEGVKKPIENVNRVHLKPLEQLPVDISPRQVGKHYLKNEAKFNIKNVPSQKPPPPPKTVQSQNDSVDAKLKQQDYLQQRRQEKQQKQQTKPQVDEDTKFFDAIKKRLGVLEQTM